MLESVLHKSFEIGFKCNTNDLIYFRSPTVCEGCGFAFKRRDYLKGRILHNVCRMVKRSRLNLPAPTTTTALTPYDPRLAPTTVQEADSQQWLPTPISPRAPDHHSPLQDTELAGQQALPPTTSTLPILPPLSPPQGRTQLTGPLWRPLTDAVARSLQQREPWSQMPQLP